MRQDSGEAIQMAGITITVVPTMQDSGQRLAVIGTTSYPVGTWIIQSTVMDAGWAQMESGTLHIPMGSGRLTAMAGGLKIMAGMQMTSGSG